MSGSLEELRMSAEQKRRAKAWVDERLVWPCPICGNDVWQIADVLLAFPVLDPATGLTSDGVRTPVLLARCSDCSFLAPFDAVEAGLVERPGTPGPD